MFECLNVWMFECLCQSIAGLSRDFLQVGDQSLYNFCFDWCNFFGLDQQFPFFQYNVLRELQSAKGIVLQLRENIRGNVFNRPFPFIIIRRIPATEKLPENLKFDGDPLSDYFVTVRWGTKSILSTASLIFPYYQGDLTIFNKVP
jgi:hypothetical protein